jgi:hypothetical protein
MAARRRLGSLARMNAHLLDSLHELHSRINDGIHVRLLWHEHDDRVVVTVDDCKTGDSFVLDVNAGESPMDVFHHPYAYAAWHGIVTSPALPALVRT